MSTMTADSMTPGLTAGIVGFKVEFENEYGKRWTVTRNWDDMVLHETQFVACSTTPELRRAIARRLGVPDDGQTAHMTHLYGQNAQLFELKSPLLRGVGPGWYEAVTGELRKFGTVLVHEAVVRDLRQDRVFHASNLVIGGKTITLGFDGIYYRAPRYYQLRIDPKAAKGRRTRAETCQERRQKLEAERQLKEAKAAIDREKNSKQIAIDTENLEAVDKAMNLACRRIRARLPWPTARSFQGASDVSFGYHEFIHMLELCEVVAPDAFKFVPGRSRFRPFANPKVVRALKLAAKHAKLWRHYYRASALARLLRDHGYPNFKLSKKPKQR